jgi:hypothetical protein
MSLPDQRLEDATKHLIELATDSEIGRKLSSELQRLSDTLNAGKSGASQSQFQERHDIDTRIRGFEMKQSRPYNAMVAKGFATEKFSTLLSIGTILADHAGLTIDRQAKRRKTVFYKWLDDHWDQLAPHLGYLEMEEHETEKEK